MRAKLPHTEGLVDRGGINIHYEVYGEGERTIVFIPTWSFVHSRVYKAQIPYFSDRFRVITFDPRGNGKSDRPDKADAYNLDDMVGDVLAVMDATNTGSATLFGYSYSTLVNAMIAAYHPDRVDAVVSVGVNCPLVPKHDHRMAETFGMIRDSHDGWEKFNRDYWRTNYQDFSAFFASQICTEKHSTKQIEDIVHWAAAGDGEMLAMTLDARANRTYATDEAMYRRIKCPVLLVHGENDVVAPMAAAEKVAELTDGELHIWPGVGHAPHGRYPGRFNTLMRDFLARELGTWKPVRKRSDGRKKALYLSSPIGLGHGRRDLAVARELRGLVDGLQIDWLAQDPVTRLLQANGEKVHPASGLMASESAHIEAEAGEHDLNAFMAIRNMDEVLIKNFMVFQEAVEEGGYDLVIADEAWDVDHYWHEHPELKQAQVAWFTDFVGWVPMPENGAREAFLTTDYNAEMIGHVESNPGVRDRAIFVGNPGDIVPMGFGEGLPMMRDWVPKHYDFSGYILGEHPSGFGSRAQLREQFGYREGEKVCIVTVGGSGVGTHLIRRILQAWPMAKARVPEMRMIVVTGPRIDPAILGKHDGVEFRAFVPDLDRHLAACDLAIVQGGLTTCMELAAAGTPFLYFPLRNHFEQNFHVVHRLESYGAGRRMVFAEVTPDDIAEAMVDELRAPRRSRPVEAGGAAKAAAMLAEMF